MREAIRSLNPECVVDLHNTSGSGPAFAVTTNPDLAHQNLASFFVRRMIMTGIRLGALMEMDFGCPIVTIECGGASDDEADIIAFEGLRSLLKAKTIEGGKHEGRVEILDHPMRVEIHPEVSLVYSEEQVPGAAVTIRADIEHCNTGVTEAGTMLGWVTNGGLDNFTVREEGGDRITNDIIAVEGGALITQRDLRIFMATTREDIAHEDCLFYVVPVAA